MKEMPGYLGKLLTSQRKSSQSERVILSLLQIITHWATRACKRGLAYLKCWNQRFQGLGILLKDEHCSGGGITLTRGAKPDAFTVRLEVESVFHVDMHFSSEMCARHEYHQLRNALWGLLDRAVVYSPDVPAALLLAISQITRSAGSFTDQAHA